MVQALFKNTDMDKQGAKLMKTLGVAVSMLNKMDKLVPILQDLGRRHVSYGVTPEMYPSVGEALLITLEKGLGAEYTEETKKAWSWVFGIMSEVCITAANEVESLPESAKEEPATEKDSKTESATEEEPKDEPTTDEEPKEKPATDEEPKETPKADDESEDAAGKTKEVDESNDTPTSSTPEDEAAVPSS